MLSVWHVIFFVPQILPDNYEGSKQCFITIGISFLVVYLGILTQRIAGWIKKGAHLQAPLALFIEVVSQIIFQIRGMDTYLFHRVAVADGY